LLLLLLLLLLFIDIKYLYIIDYYTKEFGHIFLLLIKRPNLKE